MVNTLLQPTNYQSDLELADTVADSHKLAGTPHKTFLLNRTYRFLQLLHVCFIVPRFDFKRDNRLAKV
jgi:hypothetical protein